MLYKTNREFGRWRDSFSSALYSDRAHSFNQCQRALYADFIIKDVKSDFYYSSFNEWLSWEMNEFSQLVGRNFSQSACHSLGQSILVNIGEFLRAVVFEPLKIVWIPRAQKACPQWLSLPRSYVAITQSLFYCKATPYVANKSSK